MGARKLKMWIHQPLAEKSAIENRLEAVTELIEEFFLRDELKTSLKEVYDLERLAGRISMGSANGRDLAQLRNSLRRVPDIKKILQNRKDHYSINLLNELTRCDEASTYSKKQLLKIHRYPLKKAA